MLNTSLTPNSFNGLDPLENRKQRISNLLKIKQEAEQMAAAGADPTSVKTMMQEKRKALGHQYPDEPAMKKSVNAAKKYQDVTADGFNAPDAAPPDAGMDGQMGGFNPGFGMSAPGVGAVPARPAPNPALVQEVDNLYRQSGFKGGPIPEGSNDPASIMSMLPHDV